VGRWKKVGATFLDRRLLKIVRQPSPLQMSKVICTLVTTSSVEKGTGKSSYKKEALA